MSSIRTAVPLFLFLLPLAASAQAAGSQALGSYPGFDVRYGIPEGTDLAALVGRPALISMKAEAYKDPQTGERRLAGCGEAHGVFDIPFAALLEVLENPAGALSYSPRLLEARLEERSGSRMVIVQDVGISFLGFKVGYRFRSEQLRDALSPSEVGYRLRLLESLDGTLFEAYSSVYAKEVLVGGRSLVYVRIYSRPGICKPALGMDLIIRSFTPGELTGTLERAAKAARKATSKSRPAEASLGLISLDSALPYR
jgi:hypothetical protein